MQTQILINKWTNIDFKGDPGATGLPGFGGLIGPDGNKGETGLTGGQGIPGSTGSTGQVGFTGDTLGTGVTGLQGEDGDKGYGGKNGTITGTVGPIGPTGGTGDEGPPGTGPTGPQGERGDNGTAGSTGERGENGTIGPTGPIGGTGTLTGHPGPRGPDGPPGSTGDVGVGIEGLPGPRGPRGTPNTSYTGLSTLWFGSGKDGNATFNGTANVTGASLNVSTKTYTLQQPLMLLYASIGTNVTVVVNGTTPLWVHSLVLNGTLRSVNTSRLTGFTEPQLFRYPLMAIRGVVDGTVSPGAHTVHLFAYLLTGAGVVSSSHAFLYYSNSTNLGSVTYNATTTRLFRMS